MIDLTKKSLPNTINVGGRDFAVYTDFRVWMRFSIEFESWKNKGYKGILDIRYLFMNQLPVFQKIEDYSGVFEFAFPKSVIPNGSSDGDPVLYFEYDGDYIYSAFMQQYGIDLLNADIHWHKFKALLNGLSGTKLNDIMEYRSYTGKSNKDLDSQYRHLKDTWMPPYVETEEERQEEEEFNNYFGD